MTNTSTSSNEHNSNSGASSPENTGGYSPLPAHIDPVRYKKQQDFIRSLPASVTIAEAYTGLKAEMGIILSHERAQSSAAQTSLPSPPKTNPILPLVQYSDDEEEEEETTVAIPEPLVETPQTADPGQEEATTVHGQPLIEIVEIDDDEEEALQPTPAEILLQQRIAVRNILQDLQGEPLLAKEEPLQSRQSDMTPDQLSEAADALWATPPRTEEELTEERTRPSWRLIVEEEEEAEEGGLIRREHKRKGKEIALPPRKKSRPSSKGVVIREGGRPVSPLQQEEEEGSEAEELELRWPRTARKQRRKPAAAITPDYSKRTVDLTSDLLSQMLEFDDPKCQREVTQRVTAQKRLKAGKKLHLPSLENIQVAERFTEYITGIGFEWLLDVDETPVPETLAKEFFTSFRFTGSTDLEARSVSFRVFGRNQLMSLHEFSVRMGLYTDVQITNGEWFGRDIGQPQKKPDFDQKAVWSALCKGNAPDFKASDSRGNFIADPALRLAQVYLGCNLLGQANTLASITLSELYFMWCMREQRKVHLGFWLAHSINQIATRPARHLNVCHLLGAYLRRNWIVKCGGHPVYCPSPELFDLDFFLRIQVLVRVQGGRLRFYRPPRRVQPQDQHEGRRAQLQDQPEERRRQPERIAGPSKEGDPKLDLVTTERPRLEDAAHSEDGWRLRVEQVLQQLVENSQQSLVLQTRMLEAIRALAPPRNPPHPSTSSPPGRRTSTPVKPPQSHPHQPQQRR